MAENNMSCRECPQCESCRCYYEELKHVDVLFVQDIKHSKHPHGLLPQAHEALFRSTRVLSQTKSIGYISMCQFVVPPSKKSGVKDLAKCRSMFEACLDKIQPEWMVLMGSATHYAKHEHGKFSSQVGRLLSVDGRKTISMYHPDYAVKSKQRLREYEMQMSMVIKTIQGGGSTKLDTTRYYMITDPQKTVEILHGLSMMQSNVQAYDYETTGLIPEHGYPVCLSISPEHGVAFCFYFFDKDKYRSEKKHAMHDGVRQSIRNWLASPAPKVAQNAKFEDKWSMVHFGVEPNNVVGDTKQMFHLLHEESASNLTALAYQYTDMGGYDAPMQDFLDAGHEHWESSIDDMRIYSCGDADCTRRVYMKLREEINADGGLRWLEFNVVNPAVRSLARIETRGMFLDWQKVAEVRKNLSSQVSRINAEMSRRPEIIATAKHFTKGKKATAEVNLASTPQMQYLLYDVLKLPVGKTSKKTGKPSTSAKVLEELKNKHPIISDIVKLRSCAYQLSEIDSMEVKKRKDGTIFSDLEQGYVVTGRLASRNPNLQNIKGGTDEEPSLIKLCFTSRWGSFGLIGQADYKNLELRLVGGESHEAAFINAFQQDIDMHSVTGAKIYNVRLDEFLANKDRYKKERTVGKRVNFGTVYGITEYGLAVQLDTTEEQAKAYIDAYWKAYPSVYSWMRNNVADARRDKQVRNRLGRIRHLPDIDSDKWWVRESSERIASNTKIQSLGADITMWSMCQVDNELVRRKLRSMVIGQVHDSIIVDIYKKEEQEVYAVLRECLVTKANRVFSFLQIPLDIDIETGENWASMHAVKA
jgi:DNA polymerase I-like protein with 3'-5' exonuclease and polymerase domains